MYKKTLAAIVGFGHAGRLHYEVLTYLGCDAAVVDPAYKARTPSERFFFTSIGDLVDRTLVPIDLWVISCPTRDHFSTLRFILKRDPLARILVEKPACDAFEIDNVENLVQSNLGARISFVDQYRDSRAVTALCNLFRRIEPDVVPKTISIKFTKDRRRDVLDGRFEDRSYGLLGYEWLHMLATASQLFPRGEFEQYVRSYIEPSMLEPTFNEGDNMATGLLETAKITYLDGQSTELHLYSSISNTHELSPMEACGSPPGSCQVSTSARPERHRSVEVCFENSLAVLQLEPVPTVEGTKLNRSQHRLFAVQYGEVVHDEVIDEHIFGHSVQCAIRMLLSDTPLPLPNFDGLRRISRIAATLRGSHELSPA